MKRVVLNIAAVLGSVISTLVLLLVVTGYTSGFRLVIINRSQEPLDLFLTSDSQAPAYIPAFHQNVWRFPRVIISPQAEGVVMFDSDNLQPSGAYVRQKNEVRFWSFDAPWGGVREIPAFDKLSSVTPQTAVALDHNWSLGGILRVLLIGGIPCLTFVGWICIVKRIASGLKRGRSETVATLE